MSQGSHANQDLPQRFLVMIIAHPSQAWPKTMLDVYKKRIEWRPKVSSTISTATVAHAPQIV